MSANNTSSDWIEKAWEPGFGINILIVVIGFLISFPILCLHH